MRRVYVWQRAIRESDLGSLAKLVAHTLATYFDADGAAWPSQDTLAADASITDRSVYKATRQLADAGFLEVAWSAGRTSHRYLAAMPATANELRRTQWLNSERHARNGERQASNSERRSPESKRSSQKQRARAASNGAPPLLDEECMACGAPRSRDYGDQVLCDDCAGARAPC